MANKTKDLFLCHSSEDKNGVVRPFTTLLDQRGITYWYDEAEIRIGDSISEKVGEGLRESRYVLAFISRSFLKGKFAELELRNALTGSTGRNVLPVLVGIKPEVFFKRYPLLHDTRFETLETLDTLADNVAAKVAPEVLAGTLPQLRGREVELLLPSVADVIAGGILRHLPEVPDSVFEPLQALPTRLRVSLIQTIMVKLLTEAREGWILQALPRLFDALGPHSAELVQLLDFLWRNPDIPNEWIAYLLLREAVSIKDIERVADLDSASPNLSRLSLYSDIIANSPAISRFSPEQQDLISRLLERLHRLGLRCALEAALEGQIDPGYEFDAIGYPLEHADFHHCVWLLREHRPPEPRTGADVLRHVVQLFENRLFFEKRNVSWPTKEQFHLVGSLAVAFTKAKHWAVALLTLRWLLDSRFWVGEGGLSDHDDPFGFMSAQRWAQAMSKYVPRKIVEIRRLMAESDAPAVWRLELLLTHIEYEVDCRLLGPSQQLRFRLTKRLQATLEEFIDYLRNRAKSKRNLKDALQVWRAIGSLEFLGGPKTKLQPRSERWSLAYLLDHVDDMVAATNLTVWDRFADQIMLLMRSLRFDDKLVARAALVASDAALRETEKRGDLWVALPGSGVVRQLGVLIRTIEEVLAQRDLPSVNVIRDNLRKLKNRENDMKDELRAELK